MRRNSNMGRFEVREKKAPAGLGRYERGALNTWTRANTLAEHFPSLEDIRGRYARPLEVAETRGGRTSGWLWVPMLMLLGGPLLLSLFVWASCRAAVGAWTCAWAGARAWLVRAARALGVRGGAMRVHTLLEELEGADSNERYAAVARALDAATGRDAWKERPHDALYEARDLQVRMVRMVSCKRRGRAVLARVGLDCMERRSGAEDLTRPATAGGETVQPESAREEATRPATAEGTPTAIEAHTDTQDERIECFTEVLYDLEEVLIEVFGDPSLASLLDENLYNKTYTGTKQVVQAYIDEVQLSLGYLGEAARLLRTAPSETQAECYFGAACAGTHSAGRSRLLRQSSGLPPVGDGAHRCVALALSVTERVLLFALNRWGQSAMHFSGGGTLGMHHLGVAEALLFAGHDERCAHCEPRTRAVRRCPRADSALASMLYRDVGAGAKRVETCQQAHSKEFVGQLVCVCGGTEATPGPPEGSIETLPALGDTSLPPELTHALESLNYGPNRAATAADEAHWSSFDEFKQAVQGDEKCVCAMGPSGALPAVLGGASAGSVVAALLCTHTDTELKALLRGGLHHKKLSLFREDFGYLTSLVSRAARGAAPEVPPEWVAHVRSLLGDLTFQDAWLRTGRLLNVCLTRADRSSGDVVLNALNSPDVVIWSAVIGSCCFPGLIPPVRVISKEIISVGARRSGMSPWEERPDEAGAASSPATASTDLTPNDAPTTYTVWKIAKGHLYRRYHDGSLQSDVPIEPLKEHCHVRWCLVVQVNPHIFPFTRDSLVTEAGAPADARVGALWLRACREWAATLARLLCLFDLAPTLGYFDVKQVLAQQYLGSVTLHPRSFHWRHLRPLQAIDANDLAWFVTHGQQMTRPKLPLITNRIKIDATLAGALRSLRI